MEKEIILIKGISNKGKTTSIKMLYNEVIKEYELENEKVNVRDGDDIQETLKVGKRLICFYSAGDEPDATKEGLKYFRDSRCHIGIIASRTKGGTIKEIQEFAKRRYNKAPEYLIYLL